jgi:hypothetical protein
MNTIFDILGATIIGGIIFFIILNLNIYSTQIKYTSNTNLKIQGDAETLASIIDYDLRKIGYKYKGTAITTAQSNKLSFYSDIDSSGTISSVTLTISDSTKVAYTANPHDKILYQIINNDTSAGPSLGLTNLKFTYMNALGSQTTVRDSIKYIKAEIWLESPDQIDSNYEKTYWEITVNPRNI